jgi:hypothetical protein
MKKSLIGLGVIAAMAVGGAANASYWTITNAQIDDGTTTQSVGGGTFTLGAAALGGWVGGGAAEQSQALAGANLTAVTGLIGSSLADNTLTYFSFYSGSLGYFGVAFKNTHATSAKVLDFDFTRLNQATEGVYVAGATNNGTYNPSSAGGRFSFDAITVNAGSTLYVVMGGFVDQNNPSLQGTVNFNEATAVSYLSYNGGSYTSTASASGALTSNMQFAVFTIPVPAPALLAGLGLAGALALRRRMK